LPGLDAAGEVRPGIGVDEAGAGVDEDLAVVVTGGNVVIDAGAVANTVAHHQVARAVHLDSMAVVPIAVITVNPVGPARGMNAALADAAAIGIANVVRRPALGRKQNAIGLVGLNDAIENGAAVPDADARGLVQVYLTKGHDGAGARVHAIAAIVADQQVFEVTFGRRSQIHSCHAARGNDAANDRDAGRNGGRVGSNAGSASPDGEALQIHRNAAGFDHNAILDRGARQVASQVIRTGAANGERNRFDRSSRLDLGEGFHGRSRRSRGSEASLRKGPKGNPYHCSDQDLHHVQAHYFHERVTQVLRQLFGIRPLVARIEFDVNANLSPHEVGSAEKWRVTDSSSRRDGR